MWLCFQLYLVKHRWATINLYYKNMANLWRLRLVAFIFTTYHRNSCWRNSGLAISRPMLAAWSGYPEAWRLKLLTIDLDPGAKLLPGVAHDLQLSCDGGELAGWRVANFYGEFFHLAFLVFLLVMDCIFLHLLSELGSARPRFQYSILQF